MLRLVAQKVGYGLHHALAEYRLPELGGGLWRQKVGGFAYGSGGTAEEAAEKALWEAAERYSIHFHGDEELCEAIYDPARCLHPNELLQFREEDYARGGAEMPERFRDGERIAWMRASAMGEYPERLIPAALVLLDYSDEGQERWAVSTSSGCAAGPTREAAQEAAVRELIERDAVALWWYRRARRPRVETGEWARGNAARIAEAIAARGKRCEVIDVSTEFGWKVGVAMSWEADGREALFGAGAGRDWASAAGRAVAEVAQVLAWREFWGDRRPYGYAQAQTFQTEAGAVGSRAAKPRERLRFYRVDLSRKAMGVRVVRVVCPVLMGLQGGLGNERLWTAPEELGWECEITRGQAAPTLRCPL